MVCLTFKVIVKKLTADKNTRLRISRQAAPSYGVTRGLLTGRSSGCHTAPPPPRGCCAEREPRPHRAHPSARQREGPIHATSHAEEFRSITSKQQFRLLTIPRLHRLAPKVQCGQKAFEDTELPSAF